MSRRQYYKLGIQGESNVTAKGDHYGTLKDALWAAETLNACRTLGPNKRKPFTHVCVFSRQHKKISNLPLEVVADGLAKHPARHG